MDLGGSTGGIDVTALLPFIDKHLPTLLGILGVALGYLTAHVIARYVINLAITHEQEQDIQQLKAQMIQALIEKGHEITITHKRKNDELFEDEKPKNDFIYLTEDGEFTEDLPL